MFTATAVIVTLGFLIILGMLAHSYLEHRKDVIEKENHFRDYYN